jgi:hypothetical protein
MCGSLGQAPQKGAGSTVNVRPRFRPGRALLTRAATVTITLGGLLAGGANGWASYGGGGNGGTNQQWAPP